MNISVRLFSDEERQVLNGITDGISLDKLTKEYVLQSLALSSAIVSEEETMVIDLIDGLASRFVNEISDEEWAQAKKLLPFPVSISANEATAWE